MPAPLFTRKPEFSRRAALAGLASTGALLSLPAHAGAPLLEPTEADFHRFRLGEFDVTVINDGHSNVPTIHPFFGSNVTKEEVEALAEENLLPTTGMKLGFYPTIVNTGEELVLFDVGNGAGNRDGAGLLVANLARAGYTPDQVDVVAISHMHPDHIGGLLVDGEPVFPNARYVVSTEEYNFWTNTDLESHESWSGIHALAMAQVSPLAEKMSFIGDEDEVASGISAVAAYGHTPGHTLFHIESGGKRVLLTADTSNHFVFSLQRPDWHFSFDVDPGAAAASRKRVFDMLATDEVAFIGYHMPFPSLGYVQAEGGGFRYTPHSYQLDL